MSTSILNTKTNTRIVMRVRKETEIANQLSDMVIDILQQRFISPKYEVYRYSPICWRVKPSASSDHCLSVVLENGDNCGEYVFVIGVDWFCRPTSKDISRHSLQETLDNLFFGDTLVSGYRH